MSQLCESLLRQLVLEGAFFEATVLIVYWTVVECIKDMKIMLEK